LYHCVTPVTKGTRYSLVCWTLGEPFKWKIILI
jgi:predicted 2-oxoglutarate/Fe(II)-dependent dioxygenase YbiX